MEKVSIKSITNYILVVCPHCKSGQLLEEWGTRQCRHEKCGKEFEVPYNPELLLQEAVKLRKDYNDLLNQLDKIRSAKPKQPKLQQYPDKTWVLVPQV